MRWLGWLSLTLAGCQASAPPAAVASQTVTLVSRQPIAVAAQGLSGLAAAPDGSLWAVAERDRVLVRLAVSSQGVAASTVPLLGVGAGVDTEALAALDDGTLLLGTETMQPWRASDHLLAVQLRDEHAAVTSERAMPYAPWNARGQPNRGIEGLCAAGGLVLAGAEVVIDDGGRWAPVGRLELASGHWTAFRLRLVSKPGKLSSLACRRCGDVLEALAIERDYGVARLHFFTVPVTEPGGDVAAHWVADLGAALPDVPNLEGVEWLADGTVAVVVDNDTGGARGPNELVRLQLP